MTELLIRRAEEITGDWLAAVLGTSGLRLISADRIGLGQVGHTFRVSFSDNDPRRRTVVVKLASDDESSRAAGVGLGIYYREVAFYQNLRDRIEGPLLACHLAEYDPAEGWFTLVIDDAVGAEVGDQIAGCDVATAEKAMRALARLHAPVLNDADVGGLEFLNLPILVNQTMLSGLLPPFLDRYGDQIASEHAEVCRRYVATADAHAADVQPPTGLVHGDYRLDNLLFGADPECLVIDWQTVQWGPVMTDAAYFLGSALDVDVRRANEQRLVRLYFDSLVEHGVSGFTWAQCWTEYRRQVFWGLTIILSSSMLVGRTDRGDRMFMVMLRRACQQALDLESLDLLPAVAV
ncbi:hypothetical protein TUM20983_39420 [Mycobacterium antarcticum]|uniref:phosphotransferase n=1 Tax=Mycolicibacterium sp. TUM20983 TaxID=3023369 RepID=UPI00238893E9|nr:phosphotransferase [Mycolicibacterium sp. TUM20983]GLP76832.1 hypothetical protein TUM20983_39420 [Mycolicibacterium sp. TUM20983]